MEISHDAPVRPVLLADDNTEDLFFLRRKLAKIGVPNPIVSVEDGFEAIRLLKTCGRKGDNAHPVPSILFLDIKMPGVTGFSVLSWVRSIDLLNSMKVVMLSDSDEPCDIELATELGANAYLIKYPSAESLADVVLSLDPTIRMNVPRTFLREVEKPGVSRGFAIPLPLRPGEKAPPLGIISRA